MMTREEMRMRQRSSEQEMRRQLESVEWVEVRFTPPCDTGLAATVGRVLRMFREQYLLREEDGKNIFPVYSPEGHIRRELAIWIAQRPDGRDIPHIGAARRQIEAATRCEWLDKHRNAEEIVVDPVTGDPVEARYRTLSKGKYPVAYSFPDDVGRNIETPELPGAV